MLIKHKTLVLTYSNWIPKSLTTESEESYELTIRWHLRSFFEVCVSGNTHWHPTWSQQQHQREQERLSQQHLDLINRAHLLKLPEIFEPIEWNKNGETPSACRTLGSVTFMTFRPIASATARILTHDLLQAANQTVFLTARLSNLISNIL